jgi:SAM-dependent methyltransferase
MNPLEVRNCPICTSSSFEIVYKQSFASLAGMDGSGFSQRVRCCNDCGMVYVGEYLTDQDLAHYYSTMWTYEYAESDYDYPEAHRKRSDQQFEFISKFNSRFGSVLDVGCSLGYTLSLFKKTGSQVLGIEPSAKLKAIALEKYGVDILTDFITRDFTLPDKFDLVILSHVAEHLKFPTEMLAGISNILNHDAFLYVEVPNIETFDERDLFQFSFEHINYFSHGSLANLLHAAGFEEVDHITFENANGTAPFYPTLGTLWRKTQRSLPRINRLERDNAVIRRYVNLIHRHAGEWNDRLSKVLTTQGRIAVWGAGTLTAQLLAQTPLGSSGQVAVIYDNDPKKNGQIMSGIPVRKPQLPTDFLRHDEIDILIIGSWSSQDEIYSDLINAGTDASKIVRLF